MTAMAKIKPLLPSLKEKKRYLAYEIIAKHDIHNTGKIILKEIQPFLGTILMAKSGVMDIQQDTPNRGILKISHKYINEIKAALTMITTINQQDVIVRSLKVSGILNKVK